MIGMKERFPKCKLLEIKWCGLPSKLNYGGKQKRSWKPIYSRMANAGLLYLYPISICWRLPYTPEFAYSQGWDACFRQVNKLCEFTEKES